MAQVINGNNNHNLIVLLDERTGEWKEKANELQLQSNRTRTHLYYAGASRIFHHDGARRGCKTSTRQALRPAGHSHRAHTSVSISSKPNGPARERWQTVPVH